MSRHDYEVSKQLAAQDPPFYALVMATMRKADTDNLMRLRRVFPDTWDELNARYDAPGGLLEDEWTAHIPVGMPQTKLVRIECDEDGECVLVCPKCEAKDRIYEVDEAVRSNHMTVILGEDGQRRIVGWLGDDHFRQGKKGFYCDSCDASELELPQDVDDYR